MIQITQNTIKTVGINGDFQTITSALEYFSGSYPIYKKGGINAEIKLLNGFVMSEQVLVSGMNLGWVRITSEASEINVDTLGFTTLFHGHYPMFGVDNGGTLPRIETTFVFNPANASILHNGISAIGAGSSAILVGGIKNAHGHGVFAYRSASIDASYAVLTGAKLNGAYALRAATIDLGSADLSNSLQYGIFVIGASTVNAGSAIASNCQVGFYASETGQINAAGAVADNCQYAGILAVRNSTICSHGSFIRNQASGECIICFDGSYIDAVGIDTTGSTASCNTTPNILTSCGVISA